MKIPTEGFTDEMYPSTFDRKREMTPLLMNLQTDKVYQHFTESGNASVRGIPSVNISPGA